MNDRLSLLRRQSSGPPGHGAPRASDPRYAGQSTPGHHSSAQSYQRIPSNIPPQITAADAQRAQSQIPSDMELVESEIAGEKVKASLKTIDYLKRFETFLNKTPNEKFQLLNERFFRKIPRDHGVFKTNRGKDVKCPVCMRTINNNAELEKHFNTKHKDLVQQGIEFSNGEWTASNKVANVVAMFCFTHSSATPHIAKVVRDKIKGKQYFMNESEEEEEDESLFDKV